MIIVNNPTSGEIANASITAPKLSGAQTGSAPIFGVRAWANFNGTGTVAIRASGNVSSITDNGTGNYTVNFTTAMPDANYIVVASASGIATTDPIAWVGNAYSTTSCKIFTGSSAVGTFVDASIVNVMVVG